MNGIPKAAGTYALYIDLSRTETLIVGSLGTHQFQKGYYLYIGTAQGPGGLYARVNRHLRPVGEKRQHWHIDKLLSKAEIQEVCWQTGSPSTECDWADAFEQFGVRFPFGFGASDCRCSGHLIRLNDENATTDDWHVLPGFDQGSIHWSTALRETRQVQEG